MDDNTAGVILWVVFLMFIAGLVALVAWFVSRRKTTEVIVHQAPPDQWQHPQVAPPSGHSQPGYRTPPPYGTAPPPVVDAPLSQPPPVTRRGGYRELLQEGAQDSKPDKLD